MMALSGVRSSWLILARKLVLARLAAFGLVARLDQRALLRLALGDVARHRDDVGGFVVHGRGGTAADLGPDIGTVAPAHAHFGGRRRARNRPLP